jgi:hypothetical protein
VKSNVKAIPVVDGNGDQLTLFEVCERGALFGLLSRRRLALGSGEAVVKRGRDYVVEATGERLRPIEEP